MTNETPAEIKLPEQNHEPARRRSLFVIVVVIIFLMLLAAVTWYYLQQKNESSANSEAVYTRPDGSVKQVEDYVKEKLLSDPGSFIPIHWTKLQKTGAFGMVSYRVGLVYKGKNNNNQLVMDSKLFELDETGLVLFVLDSGPMNLR